MASILLLGVLRALHSSITSLYGYLLVASVDADVDFTFDYTAEQDWDSHSQVLFSLLVCEAIVSAIRQLRCIPVLLFSNDLPTARVAMH